MWFVCCRIEWSGANHQEEEEGKGTPGEVGYQGGDCCV